MLAFERASDHVSGADQSEASIATLIAKQPVNTPVCYYISLCVFGAFYSFLFIYLNTLKNTYHFNKMSLDALIQAAAYIERRDRGKKMTCFYSLFVKRTWR